MESKKVKLVNREISWLSFNSRVLQEAEDTTVPLIERLKFLGIFSSNMDEFYRVRVATIKRMASLGKSAKSFIGENPEKTLKHIQETVLEQQFKFEKVYNDILKELEENKIYIINEQQLSKEQGKFVKSFFHESILSALVPIMLNYSPKFPYLKDKSIYLAIKLSKIDNPQDFQYSLIEVPDDMDRFVILPKVGNRNYIILLDDIIRYCLEDLFSIFQYDKYEAFTIKLTRDAELDIDNDLSKSITEKISKSLKQRKTGQPVRLVYDVNICKDLLNFILKRTGIIKGHTLIPGGRYHNFKDFINFPRIGFEKFLYKDIIPLPHKMLESPTSLFSVIKKKDILLSFPYQSFDYIIDLLREASIDPKVTAIKISIYRVAKNSKIVNALINAIKNGKAVTVVIELQARFDEFNNLQLANKLQEEGVKVLYGVPGLKVHSKLFLITRKEDGKLVDYAHVGTGNFNEVTSKIYSDFSLLTADPRITCEVEKVFNFLKDNFKIGTYKHLLVSPFFMRKKLIKLLNHEIENAKEGREAYVILKLNSLVDEELIRKLYQAAESGVKVQLIVRSICSLVPKDNMEVVSIVDRFLEHSRVFVFCNGGEEKYYISSADWMIRNLDHRTEVACPIYDTEIQKIIKKFLMVQFSDNKKARYIDKHQKNIYKRENPATPVRAQEVLYEYFKNKLEDTNIIKELSQKL